MIADSTVIAVHPHTEIGLSRRNDHGRSPTGNAIENGIGIPIAETMMVGVEDTGKMRGMIEGTVQAHDTAGEGAPVGVGVEVGVENAKSTAGTMTEIENP